MRLVLQLSKENPALAESEAKGLYPKAKPLADGLLITEGDAGLLRRLVMTRFAGRLLAETNTLDKLKLPAYKSFAVRLSRLGGKEPSQTIINAVAGQIKGTVDLNEPKVIVRVFTDGKKYWITEQLYEFSAKSFAARDVNARLVFHPASLQPKYGRILLNLSGVTKGKILDPFCGVGGLVLEAGEMGLKAVGVDIDEKYAEGAAENIWFYRFEKKVKIECADFLEWKGGKFDAVVTDLPYGRSSALHGKKLDELYLAAFKKMKTHSRRLVVMGPKDLAPLLKKAGWKPKQKFQLYMHKSLMRWAHVCDL